MNYFLLINGEAIIPKMVLYRWVLSVLFQQAVQ